MKQVVQPVGGGSVSVLDVPRPTIGAAEVLVQTLASVISPGTESAVTSLAQSSLLSKARARPDLVRQVARKARNEGFSSTLQTVRARLSSDVPLGYSAAGIAVEVGEAVAGVRPGQLVATGGAGCANHAEWQAVPGLLCVPVPDGVTAHDAAFTTISSIALHGLRLADVGPGSKIVVVGLGLVGQLAARLAMAAGCDVAGIDVSAEPLRVATNSGVLALKEKGDATTDEVLAWSRGRGADAVLVCASGPSSTVIQRTPAICRDRATVVVIGDVGLEVRRTPFYEKELSLLFARSYGPGRYERGYEDYGVDYPAGYIRWSEGRNFEAVLDMLAGGRLRVRDLATHSFPIADAKEAYELIDSRREPYFAVTLTYPEQQPRQEPPILLPARLPSSSPGVGWIGAGAYSAGVLLPAFARAGLQRFVSVTSASGLSARRAADRHGFEKAVSSVDEVIHDPDVEVVVIATPHDTHAEYAVRALEAGKHVWCEKPLALTMEDLDRVETAWHASERVLYVGHNRRWSSHVRTLRTWANDSGPVVVTYRVSAGPVPAKHWYGDRRQGGRLLGEVCHFIDTCSAMVNSPIQATSAFAGQGAELLMSDDFVIALSHENGSLSTISYATGGGPTPNKEYVEVLGGGHAWVLDDFRSLKLDGKEMAPNRRQDKGHGAAVASFRSAMAGEPVETVQMIASARATLVASEALKRG